MDGGNLSINLPKRSDNLEILPRATLIDALTTVTTIFTWSSAQSQGVPTQHVEDIPWLSSASFGVCSTGLEGYSCLSVRSHRASAKRGLNIIYPKAESYAHALQLGNLDRLDDRRVHLCYKYMAKMKSPSHPLRNLLPSPLLDAPNYPLRQKTQRYYLFWNMQVCKTKRVENFFTFKYFTWLNW